MDNSPVVDFNQLKGYKVAAAVVEGQLVKLSADDTVTPCGAATDIPIGVAYRAQATVGGVVDVVMGGECRVYTGGTITRGASITSDASGYGVAMTPAATTVNYRVGIALEAGVVSQYVTVRVLPGIVLV